MYLKKLKCFIEQAEAIEKKISAKQYDEAVALCNLFRNEMKGDSDRYLKEQENFSDKDGLYYAAVYNALATVNSVVMSGNDFTPLLLALGEAKGEMLAISEVIETLS